MQVQAAPLLDRAAAAAVGRWGIWWQLLERRRGRPWRRVQRKRRRLRRSEPCSQVQKDGCGGGMGGVMWKQDAYGGRGKLLVKDGGDVFRTTPFTPSPPTLPRSVQHLFQRNLLGFSSLGTPLLTYPSPHTFPYTAPLRPDLHLLRWFLLPGRRLGPRRGPEAAGHTSAARPTLVRRLPHPPPSGCAALGATGLRYIGGWKRGQGEKGEGRGRAPLGATRLWYKWGGGGYPKPSPRWGLCPNSSNCFNCSNYQNCSDHSKCFLRQDSVGPGGCS